MNSARPIIAVTAESPARLPAQAERYLDAIEKAGGEGTFVFCGADVKDIAVKCDGFLIPGGKDIDPAYYGERRVFACIPEGAARMDFEISLLREIMGTRKPMLGICYGMQLINVCCKGSLYQDIESEIPGALNHRKGNHRVTIKGNPLILEGQTETNTSHHQAVKTAGIGIRPFVYAADGIVEAFYREGYPFVLGVQWHPEREASPLSEVIFAKFIEACRENK
jgi:putative glutamine amidotransferase